MRILTLPSNLGKFQPLSLHISDGFSLSHLSLSLHETLVGVLGVVPQLSQFLFILIHSFLSPPGMSNILLAYLQVLQLFYLLKSGVKNW